MATGMKRWNRIAELVAWLFGRERRDVAPGPPGARGPSGMNHQPCVGWPDDSSEIVGSPRNIQEKLIAYRARGWGQQETRRPARHPEPEVSSGVSADPEPSHPHELGSTLRSSRSTWADKWQR